jgi:hypothetical protein
VASNSDAVWQGGGVLGWTAGASQGEAVENLRIILNPDFSVRQILSMFSRTNKNTI